MICQMVLEQVYYKIDIMGKFQLDFFYYGVLFKI